jgi:hypothetical protein
MTAKLLREARRMIDESGLPIEAKEDRSHHSFHFAGRRVFTLSKGGRGGRDLDKLRSAIAKARDAT